MMSAASLGLNIVQDMSEPVFEMKFESLPPASKVGYRQVLLTLKQLLWSYFLGYINNMHGYLSADIICSEKRTVYARGKL